MAERTLKYLLRIGRYWHWRWRYERRDRGGTPAMPRESPRPPAPRCLPSPIITDAGEEIALWGVGSACIGGNRALVRRGRIHGRVLGQWGRETRIVRVAPAGAGEALSVRRVDERSRHGRKECREVRLCLYECACRGTGRDEIRGGDDYLGQGWVAD